METLLTLLEHGGLLAILAFLWWHERQERIAANEILFKQLADCLDQQEEMLDEEFGPKNK